ncbi:MAG: hypothetical protein NEHIOOID_00126 [Holosporales bacterium]
MKINLLAFFVCAIVTLQASNPVLNTPFPHCELIIEDTPAPIIPVDEHLRTNHKYPEFSLMPAFNEAASNPVLSPRQFSTEENISGSPLILAPVESIDLNSPMPVRAANPLKGMDQYSPSPKAHSVKKFNLRKSESRQRSVSNSNKFDFKKIIMKALGCINYFSSPKVIKKSATLKGGKKAHFDMNSKMKVD